jgi:hypothetical protein
VANIEKKAWCEGYTSAKRCFDGGCTEEEAETHAKDDNEYTSGDTTVAWAQGHEDYGYQPVAVDWDNVDYDDPAIDQRIFEVFNVDTSVREGWMLVQWNEYRQREGVEKPAWADNRYQDRGIKLTPSFQRNAMHYAIRQQDDGSIELPCPPYRYTAEGNDLTITAGAYTKTGSKQDWQTVVDEMQGEVNELPDGIDIANVSVTVYVTAQATATYIVNPAATDLLADHDQLDNDVWAGTMDELRDELEIAIGELEGDDLDSEYGDVEFELDDYGRREAEASDIDYDLQDADEL